MSIPIDCSLECCLLPPSNVEKGNEGCLQLSQGYRSNVCDMKISNGSHKDMGLGYICIQAQLL